MEHLERGGITPLEIRRKVFHLILGSMFIVLLAYDRDMRWVFTLVFLLGLILSLFQSRWDIPGVTWLLDRFDRPEESTKGLGIITFFSGAVAASLIFPQDIAVHAIIVFTFGDPMAYVVGKGFGRWRVPWNYNKSLVGTISFFLASGASALIITEEPLLLAACLIGALTETIPTGSSELLDDNLLVPISAGGVLLLLSLLI